MKQFLFLSALLLLLLLPVLVSAACVCEREEEENDEASTTNLKIVGIVTILVAGALGVVIPIMGKWIPFLRPDRDAFFVIKAFAAGVILSTALVHVFPESFESLTNPCLSENPWHKFPFAGFITMMSALVTLMIDSVATGYFNKKHFRNERVTDGGNDEEKEEQAGHLHGHAHGALPAPENSTLRHRVISEVLELGIIVHSVIIGISLGASQSAETIKPIIAALCFHEFFEGMGLGNCIAPVYI